MFFILVPSDAVLEGLQYEPHIEPKGRHMVGILKIFKKRENPKKVRRLALFVNFFSRIVISIEIHLDLPNLSSIVPANQEMAFLVKILAAP